MDRLLWTQVSGMGPSPRHLQGMAYDSARDRVVLFSGETHFIGADRRDQWITHQDTWEWDGTIWIQMQDMGAPGRTQFGMCYDSARKRTVLFGGHNNSGFLGDTWEWDGELWTQIADEGPPANVVDCMAYDAAHGYVLLFSSPSKERPHGDTWSWNGAIWTQLDDASLPRTVTGVMAYDAKAKRILFSTRNFPSPTGALEAPPTYTWTGSAWKQISHIGVHIDPPFANMCFDGKEMILHLSGSVQTWSWLDPRWVQRQDMGPSSRSGASIVGDVKREQCVLFGGDHQGEEAIGTWVLRRVPSEDQLHQ